MAAAEAAGGVAGGDALTVGIGVGLSSYSGGGPLGMSGVLLQAPKHQTTNQPTTGKMSGRTRRMA